MKPRVFSNVFDTFLAVRLSFDFFAKVLFSNFLFSAILSDLHSV